MKLKLRYFCLFVVFSALWFLLIASWYDFCFFEAENYADMADVYDCISVGHFPSQEELKNSHLDGVSYYTAEFSSKTGQWIVNIHGIKKERVRYVFTPYFQSLSYTNYQNTTEIFIFISCLFLGRSSTELIKKIVKKYNTKKEKVS